MVSISKLREFLGQLVVATGALALGVGANAGSVTSTNTTSTSTVTLSTTGSLDWAHWGDGGVPGMTRKATGTVVANYTTIGSGVAVPLTNYARPMSWTGGAPLASSTSNKQGVQVSGIGSGFRVTLPADAQTRTARIFLYSINAGTTFRAHLSDNSAADYVSTTSLATNGNSRVTKAYYLTYRADGPGRTIDLTWTMDSGTGSVGLVSVAVPTFAIVNHAPTLGAPSALQLSVGQNSFFALTGNDVDGGALTYSATGLPPGLTINSSTGAVSGVPTAAGTYNSSFTVTDPSNMTATAATTVTVVAGATGNTAPSGAIGNFSTLYNTSVTITPSFTDPDAGDSWTYFISTQPAHGSVVIQGSNFLYTPTTGYFGPDSFDFRVVDSAGTFATGTVSGTVTPIAPSQVYSVTATQGTVVGAVQLAWGAAVNATNYNVLRGTSVSDPSPVQVGTSTGTSFADSTGVAGVRYYYSVQAVNSVGTATASPATSGYSDTPPSGVTGTFATGLATQVEVLPTYTDPDPGDTATFAVTVQPANGTAVVSANRVYYTPRANWAGTDSFTITVTDAAGASVAGEVTGTVTAPTPAQASGLSATQGTLINAVQLNWLPAANATGYDVLRGTSATDPNPVVLGNVAGTAYTDSSALFGNVYHYSVVSTTIGQQAVASAVVSGYADTPPSGVNGSFAAILDQPVTFTPSFTDPDAGDTASLTIVSQPANGVATVSGGQLTYTPATGYVGPDSFTFSVTDAAGATATGTASGTVEAQTPGNVTGVAATQGTLLNSVGLSWAASANARSYDVFRGTSSTDPSQLKLGNTASTSFSDATAAAGVTYYYSVQGVTVGKVGAASAPVSGFADTPPSAASASFTAILETTQPIAPSYIDPDVGDTATLTIATQPVHGTVSVVGSTMHYVPATGYVGPDSFTFTVTDRAGASVTGTATGTVVALDPGQVTGVAATQGTLVGAVDVSWPASSNARSYAVKRGTTSSDPVPTNLGIVTGTTYTDTTGLIGTHYYYFVEAQTIGKVAALSVGAVGFTDTPPSGLSASFSTPVDVPTTITPAFSDPDANETFTLSVMNAPANGQVSVVGGSFVYTPAAGYVGADSFDFRVTDRAGASATGTASGSVLVVTPDPVPGLAASQGTRAGAVDVTWSTANGATGYALYRGTSAGDPAPALLGNVTGLSYSDATAQPGVANYYFIQGKNAHASGPMSSGTMGFADTPPANLQATFTTLQGQVVMVVPTWTDPDPGESFTLSIVTPPQHGSAQVVSGQIRYTPLVTYVGSDTFQFAVRDRAGASANAWATGSIAPGIPNSPLSVVVTQGTVLGAVNVTWMAMPGSTQYTIQRSETNNDAAAPTIASSFTNSFTDSNVTPGATYYYTVSAVGASGTSAPSAEVSGYADTPPSAATASASTVYNTAVQFKPTVTDPDPLDVHTVVITTPTTNGVLTLTPDSQQFIYQPNTGWSGQDTFAFIASDVAGASVSGLGTVSVGCPAPTVGPLSVSQPKLFAGSGFQIATTYGNTGCPVNLSALFEVKSGTTVVYSSPVNTLSGVVSGPLVFPVADLSAGTYTVSVTVTDPVTGNHAASTIPLNIASFRMPNFTATGTLFENLDVATIAVGSSQDCTLTSDRAAALANHALCYYEVLPIPPGMTETVPSSLPIWTGKVTAQGNYTPTFSVYQYDDFGTPKLLGSITRNMVVQPLTLMTFASPVSINAAQFMEEPVISVAQTFGPPCQITTDRQAAIAGTAAGTRMCFLEFAPFSSYQVLTATGVRAPFLTAGNTMVSWTMSAFSTSGQQSPFANGSTDVVVIPPDVAFAASAGSTLPIATITQTSVSLTATGTRNCVLTTNIAKANVGGVDKPCLVEWTNIPPGLLPASNTDVPLLNGVFKVAGQAPIGFTVSYYDISGMKQTLWTATTPIMVEPPPMPQIIVKQTNTLGPDIFGVPVSGGYVGTLLVDVTKWPVDMSVKWSDEALPQTFRISPMRNTQMIPATGAPLWTRRQATVRLMLRDAPDIFVEKTFDVVTTPRTGIGLSLDALPQTVPDNTPTPLTAHVDVRTNVGPLYDSSTMGQWSVQFGQKDVTGAFVGEGAPVLTDNTGVANASINPFGLVLVRPMAKATPVSPFTDIKLPSIESPLRVSTVVKGTPIAGTVDVRGLKEGPAPLIGIFRVAFLTRPDQLANASVDWYISSDNGATWTRSDLTGLQIVMRLGEGNYLVKAGFINRNTGITSETPPVALNVWSVPVITVTGPQFAFPGTATNLNVLLKQTTGQPIQAATTEWAVSKRVLLSAGQSAPPPIATGTGQAISFTGTEPGIYMVTVKSRMNTSNPGNLYAWGTSQYQVIYGAPERPFANLTGPVRAEVGKTYGFSVNVRTRFNIASTSLTLGGRWILPDGSIVNGLDAVNYTPTDIDLAKAAFIGLRHESWVVGYESTTTTTATLSVPIWKYVWPTWKLSSSVATTVAPTGATFQVVPEQLALLPTLEGVTYTWTMPAAVRALVQPTSKLTSVIDFGGTHTISVTVADARGNTATQSVSVVVGDAKPYAVDLAVVNQSRWAHAPMQLGVATKITGGHPSDVVTNYTYFVNGTQLTLPNKSIVSIPFDVPGTYSLEVQIASKMGATGSKTATVTVPANVAPTCTIAATPSVNRLMVVLQANCQDPDGAITKYEWYVNGVLQQFATLNRWAYVLPAGTKYPLTIDLTVTDDGSAKSTARATVN